MKLKLIITFLFAVALLSARADEKIFADYFDIPTGSPAGTEVMGRIHLERNKDVHTSPIPSGYRFEILRQPDEMFALDTKFDSEGRIMGVLYVRDGVTLPAAPATYKIVAALKDGKTVVQKFTIKVKAVEQTLWSKLYERYVPGVINNPRMYGKKKLTDTEVAAAIADLRANDGRFSDEKCYDTHPSEYPGRVDEIDHWKGGTIDYDWARVCDRIGQLGYAYVMSPVYGPDGDPARRTELRDAICDAILAYTSIFPIEGTDMMIDGKPIGTCTGDGFSLLEKHKLAGHQISTHQWVLTDPLMVPVLNLMPEMLAGISAGDKKWIDLHSALLRYLQVFTSIVESRRAIDNPKERWGEIQNPNYSSGAWADANLGHRSRTMLALPIIWADYNRPMTYVQYWYEDFYNGKPYEGFSFSPGWSPHGVVADVAYWMTKNDIPAHFYAQSGYQPDGTISHHTGRGTDAAMLAYGFEWLTDLNTGFMYFKNTPYEIPGKHLQFELDRLVDIYPLMFYRQRMDNLVAGRGFLQDQKKFVTKTYKKASNALLKASSKRSQLQGADRLKSLLRQFADNSFELSATVPFWVNEYLVHRRDGSNAAGPFFASVKLKSERTVGAEDFDKKVRKSWHMGSGILQLKVDGDEYDVPVLSQFDWHALPGLTEEWRTDALPLKGGSQASLPGNNKVAGVLADGEAGMAIYHHLPREKYSSASAFKSYAFIGDRIVARGSGVSRLRPGQGKPIATFIDQGAFTSPVTLCTGGSISVIEPGQSVNISESFDNPVWIHTGKKGYVILPQGDTQLRIVTGDNINVTDPEYKFNGKRRPGFIIAVEHGTNPAKESDAYTYAMLPGASAAEMPDLCNAFASDFVFSSDSHKAHGLHDKSAGVYQFAFFEPSSLEVDGLTVSASDAAQFMLRETSDSYILSAGNPAPDDSKTALTFTTSRPIPAGTYPYTCGGIYPLEGETVTIVPEGSGSRITVELPDSRDEARYNYQTILYSGVPVTVTIPKN